MKEGPHQWPSGAATRKYVDRANDRLTVRLDRQSQKIRDLSAVIKRLEGWVAGFLGEGSDD